MQLKSFYESFTDGTQKFQFLTADNYIIESCVVFFWEKSSPINICVSSQVGCECSCSFCVTGYKRFVRNLSSAEIEKQVSLIFEHSPDLRQYQFEVTYMGTGEPLRNKDNVIASARNFSKHYLLLTRINISSIFPNVEISSDDILSIDRPVHFQYSLHFISDNLRHKYFRKKLVPVATVLKKLNELYETAGVPYCINYILFDGINDCPQDANALIELTRTLSTYIKISKYCPISFSNLKASSNYDNFTQILDLGGVKWKMFESKGTDIHAACGHLLSEIQF